jgi:hypothetical protein
LNREVLAEVKAPQEQNVYRREEKKIFQAPEERESSVGQRAEEHGARTELADAC